MMSLINTTLQPIAIVLRCGENAKRRWEAETKFVINRGSAVSQEGDSLWTTEDHIS
jgi:hypothetical protein